MKALVLSSNPGYVNSNSRDVTLVPKRPKVASPGFKLKTKVLVVALLVPSE